MLSTSFAFRRQVAQNTRLLVKATLTLANGTIRNLTNDDIMMGSLAIKDSVSGSSSFDIGAAIIGRCNITLNNYDERFDDYDFTDARLEPYIGAELPGGTVEWLRRGVYHVDQPDSYGNSIGLESLDNMTLFEVAWDTVSVNLPATCGNIVQAMCNSLGVTLNTPTFAGYSTVVPATTDTEGMTALEMLSAIAQITGNFARFDAWGRLNLGWYPTSCYEGEDWYDGNTDTLDGVSATANGGALGHKQYAHIQAMTNLTVMTDDVVITGVRVTAQDYVAITDSDEDHEGETYLYGTNGYVLEIADNKLVPYGTAQAIATQVGQRVVGMRFRPLRLSMTLNPALEAGDAIIVTDGRQRQYRSYVTSLDFRVGSYEGVSCDAESPGRHTANSRSAATRAIVDLRNSVKREKTARENAIDSMGQRLDNASGLYETQQVQQDGSTIYYMHDKPTLNESTVIMKVTAEGVGISTDGGQTYPTALDVDGDAILRRIYAIGLDADYINTGRITVGPANNPVFFADFDTQQVGIGAMGSVGGRTADEVNQLIDSSATSVDVEFNQNQSTSVAPVQDDSGWQTTAPNWRQGYYIWQRVKTEYANGDVEYSSPTCISGRDGSTGTNAATIYLYQKKATKPSGMANQVTYYFEDGTIDGSLGSWSRGIPAGDETCWVTVATAIGNGSSDVIAANEWSDPVQLGAGGVDGLSQATIYLFKRSSTSSSIVTNEILFADATIDGETAEMLGDVSGETLTLSSDMVEPPSTALTYTFETGVLSGDLEGWSRTVPPGDGVIWVTTAVAISSESTDTIAANEWAVPAKMAEDGTSVAISKVEYAVGINGTDIPTTGWTESVPTVGQGFWLWARQTNSDGSEMVTKTYQGTDGEDGISVAIRSVTKQGDTTTVEIESTDGHIETLTIKDGADGTNGTPGINGYVHIAWANSADGNDGFSTSESAGKSYIGIYTDSTEADSQAPSAYSWSLIKGADGTSVTVSKIEYGTSASASVVPSNYSTVVPTNVEKGSWLWVKTTYSDNSTATTKSYVGTDGEDGRSAIIQSTTKVNGTTTVKIVDGSGNVVTLTINDGEDGPQGQQGPTGADGSDSYFHVAWATSADGTQGFSTTESAGKTYIGVYADQTAADSTQPADYSWSLIKGADGIDGLNQATILLYQRRSTKPSKPSVQTTYTFATKTLSGSISPWSTEIPDADGNPCWVTAATASSNEATDTIVAIEWSDVTKLVEDGSTGAAGLNQATIYLYARSATSSASVKNELLIAECSIFGEVAELLGDVDGEVFDLATPVIATPTQQLTYEFATGALTGDLGGWSRTIPDGDGVVWVISAVAISNDDTDTISPSEWSEAAKLAEDGVSITVSSVRYAIGASGTSAPESGWQDTIPVTSPGQWLWVRTLYTDGTTADTCSYQGTDGEDGNSVTIQSTEKHDGITTVTLVDADGTIKTLTIADGEDGDTGTPGANGYVHVAWATSADGSQGFSTSVSAGKTHIGVYTDHTESDSQNYRDYSWSLIKGADGRGITGTVISYAASSSGSSIPSTGWQNAIPDVAQGQWLWVRTVDTYTDSTTSTTYSKSYVGTDGQDGTSVSVVSSSKTGGVTTVILEDASGQHTLRIADGEDGDDGAAGADGYTHFAYATSADGSQGFSTTESTGKSYIGVYADHTQADSQRYQDYTWSLIKGADGYNGSSTAVVMLYKRTSAGIRIVGETLEADEGTVSGETLVLAATVTNEVLEASFASLTPPSGTLTYTFATGLLSGNLQGWSQTIPAGREPCYVISATATSTGPTDTITSGEWADAALIADNGTSVYVSNISYAVSMTETQPTSGWSSSPPAKVAEGAWLWVRVTYSDGNTSYSRSKQGESGTSTYTHIRYSVNANGNPMVATPTEETCYIGIFVGTTPDAPNTYGSYTWSRYAGADGVNSANIVLYKRSASTPAAPTARLTYTFATATISGSMAGWTQTMPSGSDPCWAISANAISTGAADTIDADDWSSPVKMAANGYNQAIIRLYKRAASSPALPNATLTYTFASGALSGNLNGWSRTIPATDGTPCWVTQATAISTADTDTIASGEWVTPAAMVEDGYNQATIYLYVRGTATPTKPSAATTYNFSTGTLSPVPSGWSRSVPSGTAPLWQTTAIALSTTTTDSITASNWSDPVVVMRDGVSAKKIEEQYYLSTSKTSLTGGSWSTTQPEWRDGYYLWTRTKTTWDTSPETYDYTTPILAAAINKANETADAAQTAVSDLDSNLHGKAVFDRLTNNGAVQGIVWDNGNLYINGTYIQSRTIAASKLQANSITANEISSNYVYAGNINASQIKSGTIDANRIGTGSITINKLSSDVTFKINRDSEYRATCSSSESNSTKVAICEGFTLAQGAAITVYNSTAQTYTGKLALGVRGANDSLGTAYDVYVGGKVTSASNQLLWAEKSTITFVYDNGHWEVADSPGSWDGGSCTTSASTNAKTATAGGCVIFKGTSVKVRMGNQNNGSSPTLNISSLGAKNIYFGDTGSVPSYNNGNTWLSGSVVDFVFDGQYWRTGMLTVIDGGNIRTGSITATQIASNTITANEIASGAITAQKISSGAITADKISSGAITADKISSSAITTSKIASGAITAEKIASHTITADEIATNALSALRISADQITSGTMSCNRLDGGTISGQTISGGTITGTTIEGGTLTSGNSGHKIYINGGDIDLYYRNNYVGGIWANSSDCIHLGVDGGAYVRAFDDQVELYAGGTTLAVSRNGIFFDGNYGVSTTTSWYDDNGNYRFLRFSNGICVECY